MQIGDSILDHEVVAILHTSPQGSTFRVAGPTGPRILKLRSPACAPELHEALQREYRVLSAVHHPNVVHAVAFETLDDGRSALLLEPAPGGALCDRMFEGRPTAPALSAHLLRGVLRGLAAVHEAGFVHRDVKPEHILIDDDGEPLLCDFGFARELSGEARGRTGLSLHYSFLGTPEYMAPEQAAEPASVNGRADLFSVGVVLYELLTGRLPFAAKDNSLVVPKILGQWDRPDGLPSWSVPALEALLAPSPKDRPATATEALDLF